MPFTTLTAVETFGNNDTTTLTSPMGAGDTVVSAALIAGFPTDGQFRLLIDAELMLVTAYDAVANQWQVTRGVEGTTATSHASGADVTAILTRGSLLTLKSNIESDFASATGNVFTYREGEPSPEGAVFAHFMDAYAAAQATGVPAWIICDDTLNDCFIPEDAGDLDLSLITLSGISLEGGGQGPVVILSVDDGVTWNEGFARITGNLWVIVNLSSGTFLGTLGAGPYYMRIDSDSMLASDDGTATFDCSQSNNPAVYLTLNNGFVFSNGGSLPFFYTGSGSPDITVILEEASYFDDGLAAGSGGTLTLNFNSLTLFNVPTNLAGFTGGLQKNYNALAGFLAPFTGSGAFPTTADFYPYVTTGTMYFDQTSGQPWWWDGSAWVTYPAATKSIVNGSVTGQSTNIGPGDHVTFNNPAFTQGSDISLDTSSPYTTTLGQPSVGRITLAANHSYKLVGSVVEAQGSGNFYYQWANASAGGTIGTGARVQANGDTDAPGLCVAYITVGGTAVLVELQVQFNSGVTSIGLNAAAQLYPWFTAEEVA